MRSLLKRSSSVGALLVLVNLIGQACGRGTPTQQRSPLTPLTTATELRLETPGSVLHATIGGKETKIADSAMAAWLTEMGREVVYSGRDGAGGYENEGQSLHIYDTETRTDRKIMSEYYVIKELREVTTRTGTALLVRMQDGGLGASHVSVVDPSRGEVFYAGGAEVTEQPRDTLVVDFYRDEDWENGSAKSGARPYKTERYNLSELLQHQVIENK